MKRLPLLAGLLLLAVGCERKSAAPPLPPPPVPSPAATLGGEEGSFFWFNSRAISDAGHSFYGPFAYSKILPYFSPRHQKDAGSWFVLCDGDCLPPSPVEIPSAGAEEEALLRKTEEIGRSLCYIIAVYGQGTMSNADIDRELRRSGVTGYLGRTSLPGFDRQKFLRIRSQVALPIAVRIDGGTFKRISFDWMIDDDLRRLGFDAIRGKD